MVSVLSRRARKEQMRETQTLGGIREGKMKVLAAAQVGARVQVGQAEVKIETAAVQVDQTKVTHGLDPVSGNYVWPAKLLLYTEIPNEYVWNTKKSAWVRRVHTARRGDVVSRMYHVSPKNVELYALRSGVLMGRLHVR